MKLSSHVYLVGSGGLGFDLTHRLDCHVYLIDGKTELALVDAGAGLDPEAILQNVQEHGFNIEEIQHIFLTHAHGDHCGGLAYLQQKTQAKMYASPTAASWLEEGNEEAMGMLAAKKAGIYPSDYKVAVCPVHHKLIEGDQVLVGNLVVQTLETPGHCEGHLSFILEDEGRKILFGGDLVFYGGKISIQNIPDCSLTDYANSMSKFQNQSIDVLLPGHLSVTLKEGQRHIDEANDIFGRLLIPPNIF